jgi:hypothetical protein
VSIDPKNFDPNELPEVQDSLHDRRGFAAVGLRETEFDEWIAEACRVNVYPSCGGYEVDVILPGGGSLHFDVRHLTACLPDAAGGRKSRGQA